MAVWGWIAGIVFPGGVCLAAGGVSDNIRKFEFSFDPDELVIRHDPAGVAVEWAGGDGPTGLPGHPELPCKQVLVRLPAGKEVRRLTSTVEEHEWEGVFHIRPVQPQVPPGEGVPDFVAPDAILYGQSDPYPGESVQMGEVQVLRGERFVGLTLYPVRYEPAIGRLRMATRLSVNLELRDVASPLDVPAFRRTALSSSMVDGLIRRRVVTVGEEMDSAPVAEVSAEGESEMDYLLVTRATHVEAFRQLAEHRAHYNGWRVKVESIEDIEAQYEGVDVQSKIRNRVLEACRGNGLTYLVLGGDDTVVPVRRCRVSNGGYVEMQMPTDLYYAGLDGTWDENGNGVYGEADYDGYLDEGDLMPDVLVGRIPVRTPEEAEAYIQKVIAFETTGRPPSSFFTQALCVGRRLWNGYSGDQRPADLCGDGLSEFRAHSVVSDAEIWLRRLHRDRIRPRWPPPVQWSLFADTVTSWDSGVAGDYVLNAARLGDRLNEGWAFIHVLTHGNEKVWELREGSFDDASAESLTGLVAVVVSEACHTGAFDSAADPCLAEALLRNPAGGALAVVGSSRYGWGLPYSYYGGASSDFANEFYGHLFSSPLARLGDVFAQHKAGRSSYSGYNGADRWIQFGLNLLGDPGLTLPLSPASVELVQPVEGAEVKGGDVLHVEARLLPGGSVVTQVDFTIEGVPVGDADTTAPYELDWPVPAERVGGFSVQAIAHDDLGQVHSSRTVRVEVTTNYRPSVRMISPQADAIYDAGMGVALTAESADRDGGVERVDFFGDGVLLEAAHEEPYGVVWPQPPGGVRQVTAVAWDFQGGSRTSAPTVFVVRRDAFTEFFTTHIPPDLAGTAIEFFPTADSNYVACAGAISSLPSDPLLDGVLELGGGDSSTILLFGSQVRFFGKAYSLIYVNSQGNLTLDEPEAVYRSGFEAFFEHPRIAPFYADLKPDRGGRVSYGSRSNRLVFTYADVPDGEAGHLHTAQVEWFFDGRIRMSYLRLDASEAMVGLSEGKGVPSGFMTTDFSAYASCVPPVLVPSSAEIWIPEGGWGEVAVRLSTAPSRLADIQWDWSLVSGGWETDPSERVFLAPHQWDQWHSIRIRSREDGDAVSEENELVLSGDGLGSATVRVYQVERDGVVTDTDLDGLSDWWELTHFGGRTTAQPMEDSDMDGYDNRAEWIAGTDPRGRDSFFKVEQDGSSWGLQWNSLSGRVYQIDRLTNVVSGFEPFVTEIVADPPVNRFMPTGDVSTAFYTIRVQSIERSGRAVGPTSSKE